MRLMIDGERHVRLDTSGNRFETAGGQFGPLQMLAASLAVCTASVVSTYGATAGFNLDGFAIDVMWEYADTPHRVASYAVTLHVPETVPPRRHSAVAWAAETCTVHNTLRQAPQMSTRIATVTFQKELG